MRIATTFLSDTEVNYSIAIPSYQRAETCKTQTLATLERMGVDKDKIHIFVADAEQEEIYRNELANEYRIIVGVKGITAQRQFYHRWFKENEKILSLDDDIAEVFERTDENLKTTDYTIDEIVELGFNHTEFERAKLWGINPTMNNFYLSDAISVGLRYICANFMGSYAGDWVFTDEKRRLMPTGEDYDTSLRSFVRYGSVVRIEYLCPKTKYFAKGGIDASITETGKERKQEHDTELRWIQGQYPDLSSIKMKAGGVTNIRLASITYAKYPKPLNKSTQPDVQRVKITRKAKV